MSATLPRAHGAPVLEARIRVAAEDFDVTELDGFEASGAGEHLLLTVEKRGMNTAYVARLLAEWAGVDERAIGHAGLKDRHAVTRQRFSVQLPGREAPDMAALERDDAATGQLDHVLRTPLHARPVGEVDVHPVHAGVAARFHQLDRAPAGDGTVWYTAQATGRLGRLDPTTGRTEEVPLGEGSAPHGVIVGPDGAPWITDGGLNAIVRVEPRTGKVDRYPLPPERGSANLNTAAFRGGVLWFTGQAGVLGRLDPKVGRVEVFDAPRGPGPYGITTTPDGQVF